MSDNHQIYTFSSPRRQVLSFPPDVISYIINNPPGLEKLQQTCKYFFSKLNVLIIKHYGYLKDGILSIDDYKKRQRLEVKVAVKKTNARFWFVNELIISCRLPQNFAQIYRCSVCSLTIEGIVLSLTEFEILTSENRVKELQFYDSYIRYYDPTHVTLDVVLQRLPNVEDLCYRNRNEIFLSTTLQKMAQSSICSKLKDCVLFIIQICPNFDPYLFCQFFVQHPTCSFRIYIKNQQCYEIKRSIEAALAQTNNSIDVTVCASLN